LELVLECGMPDLDFMELAILEMEDHPKMMYYFQLLAKETT
jgi:hypothetical protein